MDNTNKIIVKKLCIFYLTANNSAFLRKIGQKSRVSEVAMGFQNSTGRSERLNNAHGY